MKMKMKKTYATGGAIGYPSDNDDPVPALRKKNGPRVNGDLARLRLDRPGRKLGGRVGADVSPLSSAGKRGG